jgi:hypothetical protein
MNIVLSPPRCLLQGCGTLPSGSLVRRSNLDRGGTAEGGVDDDEVVPQRDRLCSAREAGVGLALLNFREGAVARRISTHCPLQEWLRGGDVLINPGKALSVGTDSRWARGGMGHPWEGFLTPGQ